MTRAIPSFVAAALLCVCPVAAPALGQAPAEPPARQKRPEPKLKPGMPAPRLSVAKWVKGEPVAELQKGKVYVVEFWATWCAPCRSAIPHLSRLQRQHAEAGLVVIGVNALERDAGQVEPFVKQMGDRMNYRVGVEQPADGDPGQPAIVARAGRMAVDWMEASGNQGLPCTFIVDRAGNVAWVGHPSRVTTPLTKVIEGTFDLAKQAEADKRAEALHRAAFDAAEGDEFDKGLAALDELAALDPPAAWTLWPDRLGFLVGKNDAAAAKALAAQMLERAAAEQDAALAFQTGQRLLPGPGEAKVDADLAFKAAKLAFDLGDKSVQFKSLMASGHAAKGQWDDAIRLQTEAVEKLSGPIRKREEQRLATYKQKAGKS